MNISDMEIKDCKIVGKTFTGATFNEVDFSALRIIGTLFDKCTFDKCRFCQTQIDACTFNESVFMDTSFVEVDLSECNLSGSKLTSFRIMKVYAERCIFDKTEWHSSLIKELISVESTYIGAKMSGMSMENSDFIENDMSNISIVHTPDDIYKCSFANTMMCNALLERVTFNECRLDGFNLNGSSLIETWFRRCDGESIDLSNSTIDMMHMRGGKLSRLELDNSTVRNTEARDVEMPEISMIDTNMTNVSIISCNIIMADLTGAKFINVTLDYSGFPLHCGSFDFTSDIKIPAQLAYHLCRIICDDPIVIKAQSHLNELANKFHRAVECEYIYNEEDADDEDGDE